LDRKAGKLPSKDRNRSSFLGEDNSDGGIFEEKKMPEEIPPQPDTKDPLDLRFSEWICRRNQGRVSELETKDHCSAEIPQTLAMEGIEFRRRQKKPNLTAGNADTSETGPARNRSDKFYTTSCRKVLNFLGGRGREWTRYEFFYSDIDRAW
jgi:hypothetical protein